MHFSRLVFGIVLLAAATLLADERPNIILIMADDLGVEGLGCYGGTSYATPHLDRLAGQGQQFMHAYAQPLCTNTRVQLMTGKYNNRNWKYFGILDPSEKTIGHFMQQAGYQTCMAGKWQLQSYDPPDYPGAEMRRDTGMKVADAGFDAYNMYHSGHTELKGSRYANPTLNINGTLHQNIDGKYGPDLWVDFINDYVRKASQKDQPFFVYYPMALPHWPMVPTPDSKEWSDPNRRLEEDTRYFADMVAYTDKCVGRIVANVDALGLKEKTLILFYSDNGTNVKITSQTKEGPVVGGKGLTTDAGTHVPLIARWPGYITPGKNANLVDSTDFLPTLLEAAQRKQLTPADIDGMSFYPQLLGKKANVRPWVFCHYDPRPGWDKDQFSHIRFARDQQFKLYDDGKLFDVSADPLEQSPLDPTSEPAAATAARNVLAAVLTQMPNPEPAPRDPLHFQPTQQDQFVPPTSKLELVYSGGTFTEGPTVAADGAILFSDVRESKTLRYDPQTGQTTIFRADSNHTNGMMHDAQGRLLSCEGAGGGDRRVSIRSLDGEVTTVVDNWQGKHFHSPNDVAIAPNGTVYFTDPRYGGNAPKEIDFEGVYFIRDGQAMLATDKIERPNGILISQDGTTAYVADNNNRYGGARSLLKIAINEDGTFGESTKLFDFGMGRRGIDGMAMDLHGNVYATAGSGIDAGVYVFSPTGEQLAKIAVPDLPTNCIFGGPSEPSVLYVTAQTEPDKQGKTSFGLFRIQLAREGYRIFPPASGNN
ncbi:Gluconolactonase precursor [Bremerella volcania]|uniref:Gluconolactonase n=1 Tax=Bremerella volcania TaxID=2527984 RepID=A0A518C4I3_9BACT|nr:sulfatase-like hydrolase/transferase [Bremerella volcania]QDU74139.1 Gluconolactonase precursor [Bremerella volcania]